MDKRHRLSLGLLRHGATGEQAVYRPRRTARDAGESVDDLIDGWAGGRDLNLSPICIKLRILVGTGAVLDAAEGQSGRRM